MELAEIAQIADHETRVAKYKDYCDSLVNNSDVEGLQNFVNKMVDDKQTATSIGRSGLSGFVSVLKTLTGKPAVDLARFAMERIPLRFFEEQYAAVKTFLADLCETNQDYKEAALQLQQLIDGASANFFNMEKKAELYIRIARQYLELSESARAETALTRALENNADRIATRPDLAIMHKSCYALVLDYKRDFLNAASKYYSLAQSAPSEQDKLHALASAVTTAILSPAGPDRSRMLTTLFKDERTKSLNDHYLMLERMYLGRIVRGVEVEKFGALLQQHHLAKNAEGITHYQRAVIEHNIHACSVLYKSITFSELGVLLGASSESAEATAGKMIAQNRLHGSIDQLNKLVHFERQGRNAITAWDYQIESLCSYVNYILDATSKAK